MDRIDGAEATRDARPNRLLLGGVIAWLVLVWLVLIYGALALAHSV